LQNGSEQLDRRFIDDTLVERGSSVPIQNVDLTHVSSHHNIFKTEPTGHTYHLHGSYRMQLSLRVLRLEPMERLSDLN
jgi:hypothetical protein